MWKYCWQTLRFPYYFLIAVSSPTTKALPEVTHLPEEIQEEVPSLGTDKHIIQICQTWFSHWTEVVNFIIIYYFFRWASSAAKRPLRLCCCPCPCPCWNGDHDDLGQKTNQCREEIYSLCSRAAQFLVCCWFCCTALLSKVQKCGGCGPLLRMCSFWNSVSLFSMWPWHSLKPWISWQRSHGKWVLWTHTSYNLCGCRWRRSISPVCLLPISVPTHICPCGPNQDFTVIPGKQTVLVTINGVLSLHAFVIFLKKEGVLHQ